MWAQVLTRLDRHADDQSAMRVDMAEIKTTLAATVSEMREDLRDHERRLRTQEAREIVTRADLNARSRWIVTLLGLIVAAVGVGVSAVAVFVKL